MTVTEAAQKAGMSQEKISSLIFSRMIEPEVKGRTGFRSGALLGPKNLRELELIKKLSCVGVKKEVIRGLLKLLSASVVNKDWWREEDNFVVIFNASWFVTDNPYSKVNIDRMKEQGTALVVRL
jgi:DNA-binding transcriptional MerR regulator